MSINAIWECSDIFDNNLNYSFRHDYFDDIFDNNLPYSFHDYFDVPCLDPSRQVFSFSSDII